MYTIALNGCGGCYGFAVLGRVMPTKGRKHLPQTEEFSLLAISPSLHHPFLHLPTEVSSSPSETSSLQLVWYPHIYVHYGGVCSLRMPHINKCRIFTGVPAPSAPVAPAPSAPVAPIPLSVITGQTCLHPKLCTHAYPHTCTCTCTDMHTYVREHPMLLLALALCRMSETQKYSRKIKNEFFWHLPDH